MSRVVERDTGAQILPPVGGERARTTGWVAHCAADADLRTKSKPHVEVAGRLMVERENV